MKKLTKSRNDRMISGVLGGIAEYFGIDSTLVRIIFVVALFFGVGSPIFLYILLAILMPEPKSPNKAPYHSNGQPKKQSKQRKEAEKVKDDNWSDF
ncbi:MAG: PspC domain-containing protein [Pisciglobus halotolerans]|nr:PspC domain-containing protein [Pisciglobus halotolerans]